jgi:acyl-CoA synthetase (AMP-forming)/AMP-acid ligase II
MHLTLLLQMAADGAGDRVAIGSRSGGITMTGLADRARRVATVFAERPGERVVLIDLNSEAVPITLFGAGLAGKPFVPINYRLTDEQLRDLVVRTAPATVVVGDGIAERLGSVDGIDLLTRKELLELAVDDDVAMVDLDMGDPDDIAVLLYTSGTTGEPKAAVLRHRNLASYILSSTYAGRRVVQLESFDPQSWVDTVRHEGVTHAMVVPTMLNRILDVIDEDGEGLPSLRALSYGGGPMPLPVIERAMALLPDVGFVNAYGLTETSSTIALLGPDDHREAFASDDPTVRNRLASVGRPLPGVEVTIRDADGAPVEGDERGEIWVRGEQVSGEYLGRDDDLDEGWFHTRDAGNLDEDGFLYVHGRLDDVIVRGGENLSPGEIESVLIEHPSVDAAAVVGIPDTEWGEKVVAAVVPVSGATIDEEELRDFVRATLRSTKTPERIDVRAELPFNETGKLLRRVLRDELSDQFG